MGKPNTDPSVEGEPHFKDSGGRIDPSEARADEVMAGRRRPSEDERVEHAVWDEPAYSEDLAGGPGPGELTYSEWLQKRRGEVGRGRSWGVTLLAALVAGPWAILGAFTGSGQTAWSILALTVFGPAVEELMKAAVAMYLVEKRPFYFRSPIQIVLCLVSAGLAFAVLENLLYLNVYIPDAAPGLVIWRWTICSGMHMICSMIVGLGLMRVWRDTWARRARPRMTLAYPYIVAAVVLHGVYNGAAIVLELSGFKF